jgi:hypothetical protein
MGSQANQGRKDSYSLVSSSPSHLTELHLQNQLWWFGLKTQDNTQGCLPKE